MTTRGQQGRDEQYDADDGGGRTSLVHTNFRELGKVDMALTLMGVCLAPLARYQVGTPYDNYDKPLTIPAIDDAACCSLEPDVRGRPSHYARYAYGRRFMTPTCFDPLQMASASSLLFPVSPFEYPGLYL
jgi:hypothetical protein